jgi:methylene-tetrahydromethanopterin dehydrogenase
MEKQFILHMLTTAKNLSPFDVNMALDAGWVSALPYTNVEPSEVQGLVQDAIFSRSAKNLKRTGIFIGGRDTKQAMDMLKMAKRSMVPPFEVSVFADPSGAFTTAAALVACVEKVLKAKHGKELKDCNALVFGGTGPVGIATGIIASLAGADTAIVDHLLIDTASDVAKAYNRRFGCTLKGACSSSEADKTQLVANVDIVFCAAKAGIQVLSSAVLKAARQLKVAGDVNAVPPLGIEGIKRSDSGVPLIHAINAQGAVGVGALAVGNVKYQLQNELLKLMLKTDKSLYLDFREAFNKARDLV